MEPIIGISTESKGSESAAMLIKDSDALAFSRDVVQASMETPVIVDLWAPWCGPCKQLGPIIEKVVREARGAVRLVRIDIDKNPELASQLRIQSIPAVYAFFQGRPVDGFVGALPESQIKSFVKRLSDLVGRAASPGPIDEALKEARESLDTGHLGAASALFGQILTVEPQNPKAVAGMIRCHVASGDLESARQMYDGLAEDFKTSPDVTSAAAALDLAQQSAQVGSIPELMERLAHDDSNHHARFDLAMALYGASKREAAVDELLEIVRRDRNWNDDAARAQLVRFFDAWGPTDPLTLSARRRLSSILFS
jgi:putative thioredoxin